MHRSSLPVRIEKEVSTIYLAGSRSDVQLHKIQYDANVSCSTAISCPRTGWEMPTTRSFCAALYSAHWPQQTSTCISVLFYDCTYLSLHNEEV